jgi:hypothetical protein
MSLRIHEISLWRGYDQVLTGDMAEKIKQSVGIFYMLDHVCAYHEVGGRNASIVE